MPEPKEKERRLNGALTNLQDSILQRKEGGKLRYIASLFSWREQWT